jgi:hypothetical protein
MTDINTSSTHSVSNTGNKGPKQKSPTNNQFVFRGVTPPVADYHTPIPTIMFMPSFHIPNTPAAKRSGSGNSSKDDDSDDLHSPTADDVPSHDNYPKMFTGYRMPPWTPQMPMPMSMFNFIPPMMPDGSYNFMYGANAGNFTYKGINKGHRNYTPMRSYHNEKVQDFQDDLYEMSKDHQGSRLLQHIMTQRDLPLIREKLLPYARELSTDPFGNYFIQKWIEMTPTTSDKIELVNAMVLSQDNSVEKQEGVLSIAFNAHGTRSLQMAVSELRNDPMGISFLKDIFEDQITDLSVDLNGNHVVQELLSSLKSDDLDFVINQIERNIVKIVTEKHGCCVCQRALDSGNSRQKNQLCDVILKNTLLFTKNPYGNYVIQYIIQKEKDQSLKSQKVTNEPSENEYKYTKLIIEQLLPKLNHLCFHKYGSNVIENAMKLPNKSTVEILFDKLLSIFEEGHEKMLSFLTDGYANYVLQTSLLTSQKHSKETEGNSDESYSNKFVSILKPVITSELDKLHEKYNIPSERLLNVDDQDNGKSLKDNSIVVDMSDSDGLKTIQLQRVLGLCEHDYDRNKDKTHYFSWGPNFNAKNHDSLGLEKEKHVRGKANKQHKGKQPLNKSNPSKSSVF